MSNHAPRTTGQRFAWGATVVVSALVFAFLVAPILAIVPLSFSSGSFLTYPLPGFSLRWYQDFLQSDRWMLSVKNSFIIGIASTLLAMLLGTLAALGLSTWKSRWKAVVLAVVLSPMVVPVVITGVGLYFFFAPLGLTGNYWGLILAHTALATPFVVVTVSATLQGFDMNLVRAAASLGASPVVAFRRVTLPLILPGMASGGLFAFATSFDEVVTVLFLAGPEQRTLPREMFAGIRENISPTITAVAVILTALSIILLVVMEALRRRTERLRGNAP
ncbi:ABC transporter permease [Azospirillum sp. RWY-5-1]|uniref:ABC transporter permease n=1 Tax=Azospirillum oleiclasticum TaxID=2735135 RepID=A0ABX2TLG6_9PROT|nr:ABC transporter permease [Azospirillum oleiclasticum]NYZ16355.1 ABC transporter permease [Azospirillum oleiclasticum]NYZ23929.1 ABC transporter permease [Azospirillum oleiclasticum]